MNTESHAPAQRSWPAYARLAVALVLAALAAAGLGAQSTQRLIVEGAELAIERPVSWRAGGVRGLGILYNFIGGADGMPNFSVQTDPEAANDPPVPAEQLEAQVEALFEAIALDRPGAQVIEAGWRTVNGLRVHDSTSLFDSPAGTIVNRRVIMVHDGLPYIFAWTDRQASWDTIEDLVARCVDSLRIAEATGSVVD